MRILDDLYLIIVVDVRLMMMREKRQQLLGEIHGDYFSGVETQMIEGVMREK